MDGPTFDRRVPRELVEALAPGGPMRPLVDLARGETGTELGLDLRLRAVPGRPGARATLYLGLTQVLHVHHHGADRFRLRGQRGRGFAERLDLALFDDAWEQPQPLGRLARAWPAVMAYVDAAVAAAPSRYLTAEGRLQARLGRGGPAFTAIDREVVVAFADQGAKDGALAAARGPVEAAREELGGVHRWARRTRAFGDELDVLAVDAAGRVLVVEAKHGADLGGVGFTPAQVAVYRRLLQAWVDASPSAPDVLDGMLEQAVEIGLVDGPVPRVARPLELVPVIALGAPVASPAAADERMRLVRDALAAHAVELPGLEVWVADGARIERPGLGGLGAAP